MKAGRALFASMVYVIVLLSTYFVHVRFFTVDVVLYSAIMDAFIATCLTATLFLVTRYFSAFNNFEIILLITIWLLGGYAHAITFPALLDRSLSFYILEKLQQRGGRIKLDKIEDVFTQEYVWEHKLMEVRLTEQTQSGTIRIRDGCVELTEQGETLASASRMYRKYLLPRQRLLMGKYTNELVDPFLHSVSDVDYKCEQAE